jgi:hypothetical protein
MKSAFVLTENLDRLPLEVRRMIWGHLADMIEDHLGYRSINRGALPLSLGKFVVYTSELLLRHEVVFTLGSNPSDLLLIDTLEKLENKIISRYSSGETEQEMIYSANPVRMHKSRFGQVLDDHERPELLLHAVSADPVD